MTQNELSRLQLLAGQGRPRDQKEWLEEGVDIGGESMRRAICDKLANQGGELPATWADVALLVKLWFSPSPKL